MKHLVPFNEHILASDESGEHFFNKIITLTTSDLEVGDIYKYRRRIRTGKGKGHTISVKVEFVKLFRNRYYFKVTRILTTKVANLIDLKVGDIIKCTASDIPEFFSIK